MHAGREQYGRLGQARQDITTRECALGRRTAVDMRSFVFLRPVVSTKTPITRNKIAKNRRSGTITDKLSNHRAAQATLPETTRRPRHPTVGAAGLRQERRHCPRPCFDIPDLSTDLAGLTPQAADRFSGAPRMRAIRPVSLLMLSLLALAGCKNRPNKPPPRLPPAASK